MRATKANQGTLTIAFYLIILSKHLVAAESDIVKLWKTRREKSFPKDDWMGYVKQCTIKEVCLGKLTDCHDKIKWEKVKEILENATEVVVIDDRRYQRASLNHTLSQEDLDHLKEHFCDLTLVKKEREGCLMMWLPNQCLWESWESWDKLEPWEKRLNGMECDAKTINSEDDDFFPSDCSKGPGWRGVLDTFVEGNSYKINWTSLVKRPTCVEYVTLLDENELLRKGFITTWIDKNFPIEYHKGMCKLKIKLYSSSDSCFATNTRVKCGDDVARNTSPLEDNIHESNSAEGDEDLQASDDSDSEKPNASNVSIICATIITVVIVISLTVIGAVFLYVKQKQKYIEERPREVRDQNNLYGTYNEGHPEYNIVRDSNWRYNEDGGSANAVITDQNSVCSNIYYQL